MEGAPWGGSEELWSLIANKSLKDNCTVYISVKEWSLIPSRIQTLIDNNAIVIYRKIPVWKKRNFFSKILRKITRKIDMAQTSKWEFIRDITPDKVVINMGSTYDIIWNKELYYVLKELKVPFYLIPQLNFENNALTFTDRSFAKEVFSNSKINFFISERNKKVADRDLCVTLSNSIVTNNPIILSYKGVIPFPEKSIIRMAVVARLEVFFKQQNVLLDILSTDLWKNRNWELNFYGTGPDEDYLKELVSYYNLSDKVCFKGYVNDIVDVWKLNHILLLPSHAEGTPLALIEAMYCGRTAVVSDVGGNSELITDDFNGYIADCGSVNSFGRTLEKVWIDQDNWSDMGIKAHQTILSRIDEESHILIYNEIIQE